MTAPDHTTRAVELTTQALDADQGITIRHITVAAAQVEATLALAEAVRGLAPQVDRPRWNDDLREPEVAQFSPAPTREDFLRARSVVERLDRLRAGVRSVLSTLDPDRLPDFDDVEEIRTELLALLADDETHRNQITVAGTPAEQRHREEKP